MSHLLKIIANGICLTLFGLVILGVIELDHNNTGRTVFENQYFGYDEAFDADQVEWSHFVYLAVVSIFLVVMDRQVKEIPKLL